MRTHIKIVGIVNLIYSGLGLLGAAGILFGGVFSSLFSFNPAVMVVGTLTSLGIGLLVGAISLFGLIAGFALLAHKQWGRYTIILVSVLRLFNWPWGSLFAAYSLWVLLNDESRRIFELEL